MSKANEVLGKIQKLREESNEIVSEMINPEYDTLKTVLDMAAQGTMFQGRVIAYKNGKVAWIMKAPGIFTYKSSTLKGKSQQEVKAMAQKAADKLRKDIISGKVKIDPRKIFKP